MRSQSRFPSPTGVNYYECSILVISLIATLCFRPQQGLTIMNVILISEHLQNYLEFPSPTGVNYYESRARINDSKELELFPSPTGVNYYESLPTKT